MTKVKIRVFPRGLRPLGWYLGVDDPLQKAMKPGNIARTQKLNNNFNPFGKYGMANSGFKRRTKIRRQRTKIEEQIVRDAREIKDMAAKAAPSAIKTMIQIMKDKKTLDSVRLVAAQALIDRGYGKATQMSVTATVNADGKPSEIDDKELTSRINSALDRIERVAGGTRQPAPSPQRPADIRKLN